MFNTLDIAKRIKQARIDRNMTQMNLAEAMGVSYQAVSSWERGNAMPDISKLEDLCSVLDISVETLLGMESKTAAAVNQVLSNEPLTVEELKEVAPILPPEQMKEKTEAVNKEKKMKLEDVAGLAPFLEEGYVENLVSGIVNEVTASAVERARQQAQAGVEAARKSVEAAQKIRRNVTGAETAEGSYRSRRSGKLNLSAIADMAPFLGQDYLEELIRDVDVDDIESLGDIAPFLSRETLNRLADQVTPENLSVLDDIAPFLSKETLDKLVLRCEDVPDFDCLENLAPFLSKETLDTLADRMTPDNWDTVVDLAPFLSKETLEGLVEQQLEKGNFEDIEGLYPFLPRDTLQKIAKKLLEEQDLDALKEIMPLV